MDENPYKAPQEVEKSPLSPQRSLLAIVLGTMALIPAGCICGGLTCYSAGVTGEMVSPPGGGLREAGWFLGIPLGLLVMGFTWYYFGRQIWRHRP